MRTPVILVAGQGNTDAAADELLRRPGTAIVRHHFDGHVVQRSITRLRGAAPLTATSVLELAHGCVSCTIRNDLLVVLRKLHRQPGVDRIVVQLAPWLEPEPICFAINRVRVWIGPGHPEAPAARDVAITAVVTCVATRQWLDQALGDDELPDGRTVAQVVVGQAEFADVVLLDEPAPAEMVAVLRRLTPRAPLVVGTDHLEAAVAGLPRGARRGHSTGAHAPLLDGAPPLGADGRVQIVEFGSRRPFHPQRLHDAVDVLLDGVIRAKGRLWLSSQPDRAMWLESAGGGLRVADAGKWLAAMDTSEGAYVDNERRAVANLLWEDGIGDRHTSMTVLVCGAEPAAVLAALCDALLTADELASPDEWPGHHDPFGHWHVDPCDQDQPVDATGPANRTEGDAR
ncbi:hypothetical protein MCHIJ_15590 [Mycolicibacterium chitae]|uniref:Cobalamin synthesis protein n=3 Tax=Mycolicibacterium chitae TaxID=1792 RepID=A0A448HW01_MYCCI|nr:GTP-binding protein [Mycolicibacterium chitae]BBZ02122.1 hypothetical protein MCHIJ_15590 [Mycolicibacterium chitae]VEG44073.1 cobalamin synthesis protein [Mycolicibacterium chitae]